ncbi:hypothetical protein Nepgr_025602 [Nepenthes gracilis]|uniref:A-kinase anchor protein 17A n=1 Tax=Nepenthes gracilis TaxID=150966 RepID=A0AAD3Y184_NEPGR|nr:hypothetical protein Nepgr_025602 [Nepenthes gracilis]
MTDSKLPGSVPATEPVEISNGLSLTPRMKLLLEVHRADATVSLLDEWKLKRSLIDFLKTSFSHSIIVPEEDLIIKRFRDIKKRKRDDPVAHGSLFLRDLGFVKACGKIKNLGQDEEEDIVVALGKKFLEWRNMLVGKMDGMEVNLAGVRFRLSVSVPFSDDFERMNKEWEEFFAFGGTRGYSRGAKQEPDTIIISGLPSRWFAEPRVSSKPSMLVTHTIFSTLGKIRNLNVVEDDDLGKDADEENGGIAAGLQCKIVVQFERYKDFYNALNILCSRSLLKEGSRLKSDYEVTWDKGNFFKNARNLPQEKSVRKSATGPGQHRNDTLTWHAHASRDGPNNARTKRFKE